MEVHWHFDSSPGENNYYAKIRFRRWAREIKKEGAPWFFNWVRVIERTRYSGEILMHIIVGGSAVISPQRRLTLRWQELTRWMALCAQIARNGGIPSFFHLPLTQRQLDSTR
jgi:hypothetical protein